MMMKFFHISWRKPVLSMRIKCPHSLNTSVLHLKMHNTKKIQHEGRIIVKKCTYVYGRVKQNQFFSLIYALLHEFFNTFNAQSRKKWLFYHMFKCIFFFGIRIFYKAVHFEHSLLWFYRKMTILKHIFTSRIWKCKCLARLCPLRTSHRITELILFKFTPNFMNFRYLW